MLDVTFIKKRGGKRRFGEGGGRKNKNQRKGSEQGRGACTVLGGRESKEMNFWHELATVGLFQRRRKERRKINQFLNLVIFLPDLLCHLIERSQLASGGLRGSVK